MDRENQKRVRTQKERGDTAKKTFEFKPKLGGVGCV